MAVKKTRVAIVGYGRLGRACAHAVREHHELELAGVVRRPASPRTLPEPFVRTPVVGHVRDLDRADVLLLCVPAGDSEAAARELLQQGHSIVECAQLDAERRDACYASLTDFARRHHARIVFGAGWDPGVFSLLRGAFEMLIPHGRTEFTRRPAATLHHTAAAAGVTGVKGALAVEHPGADGRLERYVYVELERGARHEQVAAAVAADPAFVGEPTQVFVVDSIAALEEEGHGVLLERLGTAASGAHQSLLLEARGDPVALAARTMADAAWRLPAQAIGGHRYVPGFGTSIPRGQ